MKHCVPKFVQFASVIDETNLLIIDTEKMIDQTKVQIDETNAKISETQALIDVIQSHTDHIVGVSDKIDDIIKTGKSQRDVFSHSCLEVLTVITDFHNAFEIGNIDWITYAKEIAEASVQPCSLQEIAAVQEIKYETDSIVDRYDKLLLIGLDKIRKIVKQESMNDRIKGLRK